MGKDLQLSERTVKGFLLECFAVYSIVWAMEVVKLSLTYIAVTLPTKGSQNTIVDGKISGHRPLHVHA